MKKALIKIGGAYDERTETLLREKFGAISPDTEFEFVRDDSLIGGFVAYVDGKLYDASVATRVDDLRRAFRETPYEG